jgi:hypothetical protein
MVIQEPLTAQVIRVTRPDTVMVRTHVPHIQASANIYLVLAGVRCNESARQSIIDWVEMHADFGRLRLLPLDWVRDSYGRVLGDLLDTQTSEPLTGYLIQQECAEPYGDHYLDVMRELMTSEEPDDAGW